MIVNVGILLMLLGIPFFIWILVSAIKCHDEDACALGGSVAIIGILTVIGLSLNFFVNGVEVDMSSLIRIKPSAQDNINYRQQLSIDYKKLAEELNKEIKE